MTEEGGGLESVEMCECTFVVYTISKSCFWYDPGIHIHNIRIKYCAEAASGMLLVCGWFVNRQPVMPVF